MRIYILRLVVVFIIVTNLSLKADDSIHNIDELEFNEIRQTTLNGKASIKDITYALTFENQKALTNYMHALYAMRWNRAIRALLHELWNKEVNKHPKISWDLISEAPARIALANTINRIERNLAEKDVREYIRKYKYHDDAFIRAQSIIALGLNQNPNDIPYLIENVEGNDDYLIQVAISALAFMSHDEARDTLKELAKKHYNSPRGDLIVDVLDKAYGITTTTEKPEVSSD